MLGDLGGGAIDIGQIGVAIAAAAGCSNGDEDGLGPCHRRLEIGGEGEPAGLGIAFDERIDPGSKIGISPRFRRAILSSSRSTQTTSIPNSEKQAPDTRPTYPVPIIAMRIAVL